MNIGWGKNTRLRSSRFHYIKYPERSVSLGIKCHIYTRTLTIPHLSPERVRRLQMLEEIHNQGVTDKQISALFNQIGLTTPNNKSYSPKLIWVTRKKWNLRKFRENDTTFIIYPPQFFRKEISKM